MSEETTTPETTDTATPAPAADSAAQGTVFDYLPDEMVPKPATELTRFSIEHWLYLARRFEDDVPAAPVELAPFPVTLHSDEYLRRQLVDWGYITDDGPTAALQELLGTLANAEVKLWGQVRFPSASFTTHLDLPPEAAEWGIAAEQTVVPRVPFLISWNPDTVHMVTSHDEGIVVQDATPSGTLPADVAETSRVGHDLAVAWTTVVDPEQSWPSAALNTTRLPQEVVERMTASDALGVRGGVGSAKDARRKVDEMLGIGTDQEVYGDSRSDAHTVSELLVRPEIASAQAVLTTASDSEHVQVTSSTAVSIIFSRSENDEPESFLVYPEWRGRDEFSTFDRNSIDTLAKSLGRMLRVTAR